MEITDMNQITEKLYLGNMYAAFNKKKLEFLKINKVLTVMGNFGNHYPKNTIIHKIIDIEDSINSNIIQYFKECLYFIDGNNKVLVHCAAGISRSATIVIAYIMWKQKKTYVEARKFVASKRKVIAPNIGFVEQLRLFDDLLRKHNYDLDKIDFTRIKIKPVNTNGLVCNIM